MGITTSGRQNIFHANNLFASSTLMLPSSVRTRNLPSLLCEMPSDLPTPHSLFGAFSTSATYWVSLSQTHIKWSKDVKSPPAQDLLHAFFFITKNDRTQKQRVERAAEVYKDSLELIYLILCLVIKFIYKIYIFQLISKTCQDKKHELTP